LSQPVAEQVEARVAPRPRAWLLGFLYAAVFLVGGCYLPYLPVWLHWRDLNADQISILLATAPFARIVFTLAISFAADRARASARASSSAGSARKPCCRCS